MTSGSDVEICVEKAGEPVKGFSALAYQFISVSLQAKKARWSVSQLHAAQFIILDHSDVRSTSSCCTDLCKFPASGLGTS